MRQSQGRRRLHIALFLGVGLGATGLGLVAYGTNVFRTLELRTVDTRFSIRGSEPAPRNIVVVKIDDVTFDRLNERWPFRRSFHARVMRTLTREGAKVIAFDVQFSEPSIDASQDNAFMDAARAAGNLVFSTTEVNERNEPNFLGGQEGIRYARTRVGNGNFDDDPGGIIRRVPYELDGLKSFAVVVVERATGKQVRRFSGDTKLIDFRGPVGTIRSISYWHVFDGDVPEDFFRDTIVILGVTAPSEQDIHPVSFGDDQMPGAEIQANAVSTILRGLPLETAPAALAIALVVFLGFLAPLAGLRLDLRWTLVLTVAAAAIYLAATQFAFQQGVVLSLVYPFGTLALSSVGALGAHYLLAAFERERVRDVFSRFVPEAVVEQVLARTDNDLRLGGVSLVGTVMFTDLRGFTTFSESLPPKRVIECLNVYLEEMTDAILEHGGTLVSYEGDGIMAVFGAPIEQEDHADRAVAASREMLVKRLPRFNAYLREHGLSDGFRMGIGLNTGTVVSGNVGSERRLEYTAIGDTTNTASRLQGMTKGQTHFLFLADSTRELLQREVEDLVFVDEFEVRGRQGKVKIWSLGAASVEAFETQTT